tara:strand:+ start:179 stop:382 length:204 start_codon:yes stop_codon:yes gene_type:complete
MRPKHRFKIKNNLQEHKKQPFADSIEDIQISSEGDELEMESERISIETQNIEKSKFIRSYKGARSQR